MIIDPIGDLLTRIRNAYMARIIEVKVPYSKIKSDILKILKKNNYIVDFKIDWEWESNVKREIIITLNDVKKTKYIPTLRRISRPGQRIYIWSRDIKKSRNGQWIYIVSTPMWVITWYEARSLNVWWELICEIF